MITPKQSKAARALLGWRGDTLARGAGISKSTLADFERGAHTPISNNMKSIEMAFKTAGVVFIGLTGVNRPEKT